MCLCSFIWHCHDKGIELWWWCWKLWFLSWLDILIKVNRPKSNSFELGFYELWKILFYCSLGLCSHFTFPCSILKFMCKQINCLIVIWSIQFSHTDYVKTRLKWSKFLTLQLDYTKLSRDSSYMHFNFTYHPLSIFSMFLLLQKP